MTHALKSFSRIARYNSPRRFAYGLVCLSLGTGAMTWSSAASAQTTLGIDVNYNDVVDQAGSNAGAGVDVYFGPRLDLAILALTTELSGGYHDFGGVLEPTAYRLLAGGRLGVGLVVRPSVFAHAGVGHLRFDDPIGPGRDSRTNLGIDLGAAIDFSVLPLVDLGIQASYNSILGGETTDAFEWVQAGVHVTFVFDGA